MTSAPTLSTPMADATGTLGWPAEWFYWGVLDAPGLRGPGPLPPALLPEFQEDVPVPVEELHAVAAPAEGGKIVVCAASRRALAEIPAGVLCLRPERTPAGLPRMANPAPINLLTGEFEARPLRRARAMRHLAGAAAAALAAGLVIVGLHRRAEHWDSVAARAREGAEQVLRQVLPGGASSLAAEIAGLERSARASAAARPPANAAHRLGALLAAWPASAPCRPQSISISPAGASVSVCVEGDAAPFLEAFRAPAGWRLEEPRVNAAGSITRVLLTMRPAGERP